MNEITEKTGEPYSAVPPRRLVVGGWIVLLTLVSFWVFPGHHYLVEDTQVYIPILEHLWDPTVLGRDLVATMPVLSLSIYDETALALRHLTGLGFEEVLTLLQLMVRVLGILGVYLLARALKLSGLKSLLVASIFSLGASAVGSLTSSMEFEPVPRSFSFPLILFAMGLVARGYDLAGALVASIGFLYHPPAAYPFWAIYFCLALWPSNPAQRRTRLLGFVPLFCGLALLLFSSFRQPGANEQQILFGRVDPIWERLERQRVSFVWISTWPRRWFEHYLFLGVASMVASWRIWKLTTRELRFFFFGLPLFAILCLPVTYLLQEYTKWAFLQQLQPARSLLYLVVLTGIAGTVAALRAVEQGRFVEGLLWFVLVFAIPTETRVLHILWPRLSDPLVCRRALIVLLLAFCGCVAVRADTERARGARLMLAVAALLPFFLLPAFGRVNRFPDRSGKLLNELARWARASTPKEAIFLFPDARQAPYPSIFRARALRAVYVDWKSGGLLVYFRKFAEEWESRWNRTMAIPFDPANFGRYRALGIDYLVVPTSDRIPGTVPIYENSQFIVYQLVG